MNIEGTVVLVTGTTREHSAEHVRQRLDCGAAKVSASARKPEMVTTGRPVLAHHVVNGASDIQAAVELSTDLTMLINNVVVIIPSRTLND